MKVAIVGAGMAGLSCAEALVRDGHQVSLFDKGSRPGGRMSTKALQTPLGAASFDYGAQYMSVRDSAFEARIVHWQSAGVVARWPAAGEDAWIGTPGMSAPLADMASHLDVRWSTRVEALADAKVGWCLSGKDFDATYEAIVVAIPSEQAVPLLGRHAPRIAAAASSVASRPCWTVMVAFAEPLPLEQDVVQNKGAIGWAARNSAKPQRSGPEAWVIQAGAEWSADHLEFDRDLAGAELLKMFGGICGFALPAPLLIETHRWRYAKAGRLNARCLWDADRRLGACGDWLIGPRVEAAWLSGARLADVIAGKMTVT